MDYIECDGDRTHQLIKFERPIGVPSCPICDYEDDEKDQLEEDLAEAEANSTKHYEDLTELQENMKAFVDTLIDYEYGENPTQPEIASELLKLL